MKFDPKYKKIDERFLADPEEYRLAFAKVWYKLTHRDMRPPRNFLGKYVLKDIHIWQDPISQNSRSTIDADAVKELKIKISESGLTTEE